MGQGMIFIPDQCIGRMGIGMLHFPHTDILVPDQGRNGCRDKWRSPTPCRLSS